MGTCRCDSMELIMGDLKALVWGLLPKLCNAVFDLVGVGSAFADLKTGAGVGVSGACTEENAFLAEWNVARGDIWVESGSSRVGGWSGRSSCHFAIFS